MSKARPAIGDDGSILPLLPPERDPRLWTRLVRVMFFTPGFVALLLIKAGEPAAFGITVELLLLSCAAAVVGGLFVASQSSAAGCDAASQTSLWSGGLILEFLSVVPFLCALPPLFHQLAHSTLLHPRASDAVDVALGASELIPAMAILPFMLYQLCGFGTMNYLVSKATNWLLNLVILGTIVGAYLANRKAAYGVEEVLVGFLVVLMLVIVFHGVLKLKRIQALYDAHVPAKPPKEIKVVEVPATTAAPQT
ncbi:MAG: hypothetical protein JNK99_04075 [Candidatus Accumulibacter sp.]|uniref:hypothetical protein n=1 Tax=Accumulibacter sp. TaxID=2053492 RepID=UPI001A60645C|nr:hypothetical protein [Accumulibacter sp.]MBL8393917.1 hypothetical protein [Accumulibacter sp.]